MSDHLTVRVPADMRERLTARARAERKSRSAITVEALQRYLDDPSQGPSQADVDTEMRRLDELDRQEPDYVDYLEGDDHDPFAETTDNQGS